MFTVGPPLNVEFEPAISKIEQVGPSCVALAAGNSLYAREVISRASAKTGGSQHGTIIDFSNSLKLCYAKFRDEKMDEHLVRAMFGLDFTVFREKGGILPVYLQMQPAIYGQVIAQSSQYNIDLELIVAGTDKAGSHIFSITHPGSLLNFDKLGYNAIGSGAVHSVVALSLGGQTPRSPVLDTLFSVYSAKRAAEVAPGVGKETEIAVISTKGILVCGKPIIDTLASAYSEQLSKAAPNLDKVKGEYEKQQGQSGGPNQGGLGSK